MEFSGIMSNPTYAKVQEGAKLARASAMAENGVLKIGKVTDFQAHQIQHQLGAYTDFRAVADSTNVTAGCCKKLTRDEICEILQECL